MDHLKSRYEPVDHIQDATLHLDTQEFFNKVNKGFPGVFSIEEFTEALLNNGYCFDDTDLDFEWLLREND